MPKIEARPSTFYKGAFNNYVDRILPFFDPFPCVNSFLYKGYALRLDKNRHFLIPSPLILCT